jgi:hypothetical protein
MNKNQNSKKSFWKGFAIGMAAGIFLIITFFLMVVLPLPG